MSVVNESDRVWLECDGCGETTPVAMRDEFQEMVDEAKRAGWSIARPDGEWEHHCSSCKKESRLEAARRKFGLR